MQALIFSLGQDRLPTSFGDWGWPPPTSASGCRDTGTRCICVGKRLCSLPSPIECQVRRPRGRIWRESLYRCGNEPCLLLVSS
ncbi:hypothetical protein GQ53DRAFT_756539 [Thozetella sp. PMI_491]|nr:hypothetical protein GQ53DRAFT_756539 [Thozetella sp. PMI_491]